MYPFVRMLKELVVHSRAGSLPLEGIHVSRHICWPWDLDLWLELNNGRTLSLFDLGRIPLARRTGVMRALKTNRWGLTVAGVSVRYRKRIRVFEKIEMRSRALGWDDRFFYLEQSIWKNGEATTHALYRTAITNRAGIVPPAELAEQTGHGPISPPLPDWVQHWIAAEAERPWPPQM